jgi:hypothetical protein
LSNCVLAHADWLPLLVVVRQILARALGGEVGKNPNGNFTLTIEHVWTTGELQQYQQLNTVVQQALATISSPTNNPSPAVMATSTSSQDQADCQPTGKATQASTSSAAGAAAAAVNEVTDGFSACTAGAVLETPQTTQAGMSSSSSRQGSSGAQPAAAGATCHGCFKLIESHGDQVRPAEHPSVGQYTLPVALPAVALALCSRRIFFVLDLPAVLLRLLPALLHSPGFPSGWC